jgi:ankyrin repeat protein
MARYAAEVWTGHAALAQGSEDIVGMTVSFLEKDSTFQRWSCLYQADMSWAINPGSPQGSRLYYACLAGLVAAVRDLINKGANVSAQGGYYGNALEAASFRGHQETVKLLQRRATTASLPKQSVSMTISSPAKKLRLMDCGYSD